MIFKFDHFNFNVADLDKSLAFYNEALGLTEQTRKAPESGEFILSFLSDAADSHFRLELTWMRDRVEPYDLGEVEYHLAFKVDDYDEAYNKHKEMGCICYENTAMGIYFIEDPDGYWIEIIPLYR